MRAESVPLALLAGVAGLAAARTAHETDTLDTSAGEVRRVFQRLRLLGVRD